jgi:sigma-B regulation protein RsbU (phosphoserine phosphatase)
VEDDGGDREIDNPSGDVYKEGAMFTDAETLRHLLLDDLDAFIAAVLLLFTGLVALSLPAVRRGSRRDPVLISFGLLAFLFGLRLLAYSPSVRAVVGGEVRIWEFCGRVVTYLMLPPGMALFRSMLGDGWRGTVRLGWWSGLVFAPLALIWLAVSGLHPLLDWLFVVVVVFTQLGVAISLPGHGEMSRAERVILIVGYTGFLISIVSGELLDLGITSEAQVIGEHFGFLCLIILIGWVVQRRFIGNEVRVVRIQEELETARRIQRAVLPVDSPSIKGLELESRYLPMEQVAGDYFGREVLPNGSLLLILADASGHGVPAAIIASMVHVAFIRELAVDPDTGTLLTAMNRVLHDQLEFQFVTAAVAWISPDRSVIRYAGAAHPPMLLWQYSRGAPVELVSGGRMIGYFPQERYESVEYPFEGGDVLLLFSDGLIEVAGRAGEEYGSGRLARFLHDHHAEALPRFADGLLRELAAWRGAPERVSGFEDDLTFMVVRNGTGGST